MSYIYCITNEINNKMYVGKTALSINKRFKEHCSECWKERCEKRPLYDAMQKYGIENFSISLIETCTDIELADREIFWIMQLNSFKEGYNCTLGGDEKILYDYKELVDTYNAGLTIKQTAERHNCSPDTVSTALHTYNIDTYENSHKQTSKIIHQYSLKDEFIQEFASMTKAATWLFENNYTKNLSESSIRVKIASVANGKAKTAYKFKWKFK